MRTPGLAACSVTFALLLSAVPAGITPTALGAARAGPDGLAASFATSGRLSGVAATSARNAWAVGSTGSGGSLILRWNGTTWKRVPSPGRASLSAVTATSAQNAWAVGATETGKSLILHWNGTTWKQVPSPSPNGLSGVAATSAGNAWAVGDNVILRWNGSAWKRMRSPGPAGSILFGVAATSARNAWAVGGVASQTLGKTLILRWNGASWKRMRSPTPALSNNTPLLGVAAASARSAWAVGCFNCAIGGLGDPLIERWNGTAWKRVASPSHARIVVLSGVAATTARNAWAVGSNGGETGSKTVIVHWNGTAWKKVPSPSPGAHAFLSGVAAASGGSAWAVGSTGGTRPMTLILHWNGKGPGWG